MPPYITQADLVARVGAAEVNQLFDDDGNGLADAAPLATVLLEASSYADSFLVRAFGTTNIALTSDERFKGAVSDIALGIAGERRSAERSRSRT